MMLPVFDNPILSQLHDGAVLDVGEKRLAFSTDTFTVDPIFFPGGSIGELAVNGTVNDIAMCGAMPRFLSTGFVIEEGFPIKDLEKILNSMAHAAREACVDIVSGDTKVVPKGAVDKIFVNTSGIGIIAEGVHIGSRNACPGDKIILSGSIADHGIAILTQREHMNLESGVKSDTACLNHLVNMMLGATQQIHVLRDPTRGGVGTALNEIAVQSQVGIMICEENILIRQDVLGICELLGLDPLYIANEGKLLAFVDSSCVEAVLRVMHEDKNGKDACVIGEAVSDNPGMVWLKTRIGGTRILDMMTGDQLPRIC
jgi:hydrogenase expression/formation protein HypE